jgi:cytochrome c peroxidase
MGCVLALAAGCERESPITRLEGIPAAEATQTAMAERIDGDLNPRLLRRFTTLPSGPDGRDTEIVRLGRMLYYEPLLSRNGKISCDSCHPLDRYGTTKTRFSTGVDGKPSRRNAPTVYNAAGHFSQFWDGRAANLAEQAIGPIEDPTEMGMDAASIERVLGSIPAYRELFARAFPGALEPISILNVARAIAEFERGLTTPSRWDRYLAGDREALNPAEKEGAKLFANLGCMVCHTGPYVGGTMFEKLGIFVPWPNQSDHGRGEVTHNPADDMVFKVPSLRNVALTAPYFHDGSVDSLDAAVRTMARHQLGVDLTEDEAVSIATWLGSLTGEIPRDYIAPPRLPEAKRP